ncbi:MAG: septal ring factor EnvC (AmiA/AmiB activator) [Paraglaciecola sp.]|jgi:septal ring factor EnvC (AmiA/AmiB activator)
MFQKKAPSSWCLLLVCLLAFEAYAQSNDELKAVQQQIKHKQQQIAEQLAKAKILQAKLKQSELAIAQAAKGLNTTQSNLTANSNEQDKLKEQQQILQNKLKQQQQVLAKQIRSAFMTGNYDYAKMLLNQQDAAKFERTITYYQYLNKARRELIDEFLQWGQELRLVDQQLIYKQQQLEVLHLALQDQQTELNKRQASRQLTLVKIQLVIESDAGKVEELQVNEQNLRKALAEAERLAALKPTSFDGLSKLKGQLLQPARGRIHRLFGDHRQGQVRWKGILIDANAGDKVVAVHDGRVLYADWLRGFGLVTVLDHGKGYMSLYGHNQALLRQVGDVLSAGESIALVGQSGGQESPNLYFEIRHKGIAVNPSQWLKP